MSWLNKNLASSTSIGKEDPEYEDARWLFQCQILQSNLPYPVRSRYSKMEETIYKFHQFKKEPPVDIRTHAFDGWDFEKGDISAIALFIFDDLFDIGDSLTEYALFVLDVVHNYMKVKYHNIHHAISHMQSTYFILYSHPDCFPEREKKALIISSLCHDIWHPGYQEELFSMLASASDWSVKPLLESHHTQAIFILLMGRIEKIFGPLTEAEVDVIACDIKRNVYATYPGYYKAHENKLEELAAKGYSLKDKVYRDEAKALLMIISDLSSLWKRWPNNVCITKRLYAEFDEENDIRIRLALPLISALNTDCMPNNQIAFIRKLAWSFLKTTAALFPCLNEIFDTVEKNIASWTEISENKSDS